MSHRETNNGLTPPIGTSFYKETDLVLLDQQSFPSFSNQVVSWRVTMCKYAVNAVPTDPNFQANNGRIYIIILHTGSFKGGPKWTSQMFAVQLEKSNTTVSPDGQHPGPNEGIKQEDGSLQYNIDFTRSMAMFKNQGNESFVFDAKYIDSWNLKDLEQSAIETAREHEIVFDKDAYKDVGWVNIHALTVYKCLDPTQKLKITFGHNGFSNQTQLSEFYKDVVVDVGEF